MDCILATSRMSREAYCKANDKTMTQIQGLVVRHTCNNLLCINPEHLVIGTQRDNIHDMIAAGRRRPESQGKPKCLTSEQVAAIRKDFRSNKAIAADYKIHPTIISRVKNHTHAYKE